MCHTYDIIAILFIKITYMMERELAYADSATSYIKLIYIYIYIY